MKKKNDVSMIALLIIILAFFMAAAIILSCVKLSSFDEVIKHHISILPQIVSRLLGTPV